MEVEGLDSAALRAVLMRIDNFTGEYDFLDPDYRCIVLFNGLEFRSIIHGVRFLRYSHMIEGKTYRYDAQEQPNDTVSDYISRMDTSEESECREENPLWAVHRHEWLELLLRDKFRRNGDIRNRLGKTGDRRILYISEDMFLGSDGKNGQNKIGRITEQIRDDVAAHKDHRVWLFMCQNMCSENFSISIEESKDDGGMHRHRFEGKCCYDIGRIPSCDLKPANPSISRVHASICMNKRGRVCLVNYNTATGVSVNGNSLKAHEPFALTSGDKFTLGASKRIYRVDIDANIVSETMATMERKRRELQRKAAIQAQRVNTELETFLKGHDEIIVLNVSYKTKRADLYDFFSSCGDVESVQLPQSRGYSDDATSDDTLAQRGIAFIKFRDTKSAARALERDGMYLNYRKIQVKYKSEPSSKPRRQSRSVSRSRSRSGGRRRPYRRSRHSSQSSDRSS
ncbi:uncharacterized protein BXIN_2919 [Babesia sp. Xinjiang]|uniref:uncharacterized protein n=1 Tax=Babesia sp. Xinjiang TaxID=462227 RepID=UPI000A25CAB0|nr:uncharacterized protein BXIN_2919 [Babesia sp. Xinjiang]ORM39562.1 hypothetical protein BXIN_2919 [Babesia sp. Xinjiang]